MQGFRHTIVTGRNGKCKFNGCTEVETACEAEGKRSACLCFEDPLHLARPTCLMKRQLQSSLENKQDRNRNECNITNSSTLDVQHSGLGVGRFLRAHMAVTDNKVSHVFKTLGTELQMCPIMS